MGLIRVTSLLLLMMPIAVQGQDATDAGFCNAAALSISEERGMPKDVLLALTLVETGRTKDGKFLPWPWTVNMEGKGYWFNTKAEALDFVKRSYAAGARSFDVGCFQINHRWHGQAFVNFEQMFDPLHNARYAAEFMTSLYNEGGSWSWAAGAYHSRTVALAGKYRTRFDRIRANLPSTSRDIELPVMVANAEPTAVESLSTWGAIQLPDSPKVKVVNGSLAGGLLGSGNSPLLTAPNGSLF